MTTSTRGEDHASPPSRRAAAWAATMAGHHGDLNGQQVAVRVAHADSARSAPSASIAAREVREEAEQDWLSPTATRSVDAGTRHIDEPPDPLRTCFERDRDRILHGTAFRRLAGKTQVVIFPDDHQRTRLTHALEVAQVATAIARACRLNVALTEAIALGHDCGHGPGGHASEDAFGPYLDEGYDHAVWGADVVLGPLNLCLPTLDGIRNHSWSRPAPATPEGEAVSWADRIAYVCHDFEDAVHAGIVTPAMLPEVVRERCGDRRSGQLHAFIGGVVDAYAHTGHVSMVEPLAEALSAFRAFNYECIYMRPSSIAQSESIIRVLRSLVEFYADRPNTLQFDGHDGAMSPTCHGDVAAGGTEAIRDAVTYVAGMTDRYAFTMAIDHLGWDRSSLPLGVDWRR
ncbi:MAG TPA: HD domain-containing protein [Microthrixaceae bacterium]|nr:HD domain-containing protein [Microthrixaceae bacterium]